MIQYLGVENDETRRDSDIPDISYPPTPLCLLSLVRLENLAHGITEEYAKFEEWHQNCDNVNQFLLESERLIRTEEKIGDDIEKVKEQIKDNNVRRTSGCGYFGCTFLFSI